jgi:leucyl/phenylalanyl-tRNA--protein transferase
MQSGDQKSPIQNWSALDWAYQYAVAAAYGLRPKRAAGFIPALRTAIAHYVLPAGLRKAPPGGIAALDDPEGFAGICSDLSVETLMAGYHAGIYQTSHAGPYKWWAPAERMVLFMDQLKLEKNLKRKLRQGKYKVTFDAAFADVVTACAGPRAQRRIQLTWLTPPVREGFERLFEAGHAHSVEIWDEEGNLAGGLFGVSYGRVFATESQFAVQRDASKVAFSVLNRHLQSWGYVLNDVRRWTPHLEKFGCHTIPHTTFSSLVRYFGANAGEICDWQVQPSLCSGNWDPAVEPGWREEDVLDALFMAEDLLADSGSLARFRTALQSDSSDDEELADFKRAVNE